MQQVMTILFYLALAGVFFILALGIVNLARTDPDQASRSNKLMRMRVIGQAICVVLILIVAWLAGKFG